MTTKTSPKYGMLIDYQTGATVRPATKEERDESYDDRSGPEGLIWLDGIEDGTVVFVDGGQ